MAWIKLLVLIMPCIFLWPCFLSQAETDTLKPGQLLHDWEHLVSAGKVFKLGFFGPSWESLDVGAIAPRYIGIWFNEIPYYTLWVANPNNPVPDSSGVLTMDTDGILKIAYKGGSPIAISSNQSKKANPERNITATLLDSGNLVLREVDSNGVAGPIFWQSFDYPSNSLLPEMKLGFNLKTGHECYLSSWVSEKVPSPGAFRLGLNPNGTRELMIWRRGQVYWRSGEWKNGSFELAPEMTSRKYLQNFRFVKNENESYFSYSVKSRSDLSRWEFDTLGQITQFTWDRRNRSESYWIFITSSPCNTDYTKNETAVCLSEEPISCRNGSEFFSPKRGYMDTNFLYDFDDNASLALSDCHAKCWKNCSCAAYQSYSQNGTGCQFWNKESKFFSSENSEYVYLLTVESAQGMSIH